MQYSESASCGNWFSNSDHFQDVANLRLSVATSGAPVLIQLVSTGTGEPGGQIGCSNQGAPATFGFFRFVRDGVAFPSMTMGGSLNVGGNRDTLFLPCSVLSTVDRPPAGDHVYIVQARAASAAISGGPHGVSVLEAKLVAAAM